jgi:hypothetical protein
MRLSVLHYILQNEILEFFLNFEMDGQTKYAEKPSVRFNGKGFTGNVRLTVLTRHEVK